MLELKSKTQGAEITSIKYKGVERMHDGVNFWNRHAPVLFPIVGQLKDGQTKIEGNIYKMGQHGFARDMEFEKIGDNSYVLKSNEETLKKFPYKFELYISYEVKDNSFTNKYRVVNKDDKLIYFGLGSHPAFVCDYKTGNYYIEFEDDEKDLKIYQLEKGLFKAEPEKTENFIKNKIMKLDEHTFDNDAIAVKNNIKRKVYIKNKNDNKAILSMEYKDFPTLGIWSKVGANFVCLEPWLNHSDYVNSNGIFSDKENVLKLKPNEEFSASWTVEFF